MSRVTRRGMVLPLVLIGLMLMTIISVAVQQSAWRAARGARTTWDAQRGLYSADASLVRYVASWQRDSMAATPIGVPLTWIEVSTDGWRTRTTLERTGTLVAIAHAVTDRAWTLSPGATGDAKRIHRAVHRALRLEPPQMPIRAAATVLGGVDYGSVNIDGRDSVAGYDAAREDCGLLRDTASMPALASVAPSAHGLPVLTGGAVMLGAIATTRDRLAFDSAFGVITARATVLPLTVPGTIPVAPPWRAIVIQTPGRVTVDSTTEHRGLLVIDGDLTVRGALTVDGLLIVRGALDASLGSLTVRGALVVRDHGGTGTRLDAGVRIRLAPCLIGRALVAVSEPRSAPFGVWNAP